MKDYYDILGVSELEQEIKKAYRKIAMKNHRDRNPGHYQDYDAVSKQLKPISEVSNSQKKQQYDRFS